MKTSESASANSNTNVSFDVFIAGGGLSGCLMALSLAKLKKADGQPLSIAIAEANGSSNDMHDTKSSFDERVLALSHGTANYFKQLNIWPHLKDNANPIETIHISDRGYYGKARVYAKDHNVEALGYVAKMKSIGNAFHQALASSDINNAQNIHWFCPNNITNIEWHQNTVNISLNNDEQVSSKLLLACDGAQSVCRQFANIKTQTKPYGQSAVIANVEIHKSHNNIAYERFTEMGPIAMLPLSGNLCSLVWTVSPEQAKTINDYNNAQFISVLNQAFGFWQGGVKSVSKRFVYPLNLVQANENAYHRLALIGNASHTIHPIAGQGFNLGVRDVAQLANSIENALKQDKDIGNFAMLNEYAQARLTDQQQIINLTDSLVTLFSNSLPPLVAGRNIALKALNYISPIKQAFVNKTMGY